MATAQSNRSPLATTFHTPLAVQILTLLGVIAVWEVIGRTDLLFPDLFPSIIEILQSLWTYVTTPVMIPHIKASLYEVGGAIAIAALAGVPLGILWGSKHSWLEIVEPLILYAAVVPKIVIFPVFILFLGIDVYSKLAVGAIAAFFPISLLTIAGMREVKKVYVDVARTIGASPWQIAKNVYLPAIAGQVFTGIRIGLGAAVTGALLAETKIAKAGLGFMIVEYYGQFRIADMYALLLFIFILASLANWAMKSLFGWLSPISRRGGDAGMYF
ncbi:MAG: ABC transporter permease [Deltaproteobacteria bacterium]|nr:ABC transporter permease [Deltaproteobacteria bacterium]